MDWNADYLERPWPRKIRRLTKVFFSNRSNISSGWKLISFTNKNGQLEIKPWAEEQEAIEINQFNVGIMLN